MAKRNRNRFNNDERDELENVEFEEVEIEKELSPIATEMDQSDGNLSLDGEGLGYILVDTDLDEVEDEDSPRDANDQDDFISIGTNVDEITDRIGEFTDDEDVIDDFADRQGFRSGSDELLDRLLEHHSKKPELSGGDIDAAWELSDVSGEESVGGTVPTPDQDVVEELGEAVGIEYEDDEPLNTMDKLRDRDLNRWELDPESTDEQWEDLDELDELDIQED
jgi:hypothetical protein